MLLLIKRHISKSVKFSGFIFPGHRTREQGTASCWNPAFYCSQRQNPQVSLTSATHRWRMEAGNHRTSGGLLWYQGFSRRSFKLICLWFQSLHSNVSSKTQPDTSSLYSGGGRGWGWHHLELWSHQRLQVSTTHPGQSYGGEESHQAQVKQTENVWNIGLQFKGTLSKLEYVLLSVIETVEGRCCCLVIRWT